jgi:hypothetical protein
MTFGDELGWGSPKAEAQKVYDGASRIELEFPQSLYDKEMVRAIRYGGTRDRLLL